MNKVEKLLCKLFCGLFENIISFHLRFCELKLMDFYCIPVVITAKCFRMDKADTWLFKGQDKQAKTAFPIPNSPGNV